MTVTANGRWSAIVTAIDPFLGDPTTVLGVLTTPNPVPTARGAANGGSSSGTIGPGGGSVSSADGRFTVTYPAGALPSPITFTVQPITNLAWGGLGKAYEIGADAQAFAVPATLTFAPTQDDTSGVSISGLGVGYQDADGYWHWLPNVTRDASARRVSVSLPALAPSVSRAGVDPLTVFRIDAYSMLQGYVLKPEFETVEVNKSAWFHIDECYPVDAGRVRWPGVPCKRNPSSSFPQNTMWYVDAAFMGDPAVGTIRASATNSSAEYVAPDAVPLLNPVAVSAESDDLESNGKVTVISHVNVTGPEYSGSFTLDVQRVDGARYKAQGHAELHAFHQDENGIAYDMTGTEGTITIDPSFTWNGLTCTCQDERAQRIPEGAVFSIQKRPTLAQRWVMPAATWHFLCLPPGSPNGIQMLVSVPFFVAPQGDCSQQEWVPLSSEQNLTGSYVARCNPSFTVNGSWNFTRP